MISTDRLFDLWGAFRLPDSAASSAIGYTTASWRDYMLRKAGRKSPFRPAYHFAQFRLHGVVVELLQLLRPPGALGEGILDSLCHVFSRLFQPIVERVAVHSQPVSRRRMTFHYSKAAQAPKELRRFPPYCGLTVGREDRAMTSAIKMEPIRDPAHSPATPRSVKFELTQPKNRCH